MTGNNLSYKEELTCDLKRLCVVFGHIERLIIFAASIHRKLLDIPRLSEAIFNDYFNYYLPKMGTSFESICYDKVLRFHNFSTHLLLFFIFMAMIITFMPLFKSPVNLICLSRIFFRNKM